MNATLAGGAAVRRRRLVVACLALIAGVAGVWAGASYDSGSETVGDSTGGPVGTDSATGPPPAPACASEISSDPARLAGQMLMVRMEATATQDLRRRARRGELGGVILFPPEGTDPQTLAAEVARLDRIAEDAGFPAPLVAIDQEGGEVKRLPDAPPDLAPPEIEAAGGAPVAAEEGLATGRALAGIGVDIDLAPVLDVPAPGSFISSRAFSDDPEVVAELGTAFADGLAEAGVAATAKHFPGLGLAPANTDEESAAIEDSQAELKPGLAPFRAAIESGIPLVMVANAVYPAYDPDIWPAGLSRPVIEGLLRDELGFEGVVITDDLGAGAIVGAGYDEASAALTAVRAGVDLPLFALTDGSAALAALAGEARSDQRLRERMVESCARISALRARLD